jgi:hypothetical protein
MWIYVLVAGVFGLVPGVAYFLIGMETWMIFSIAHDYNVDNTGEIVFFCIKSGAISAVLKTVAHALHFAPLIGQVANSIVAMLFVFALHSIADSHYAHLSSVGKHPDAIPEAPHSQSPKR